MMPPGDGSGSVDTDGERALERECLRLCDRYVAEVVLAFGLCPWAEGVLRAGTLARRVLLDARPAPADVLPIIDAWAGPGAEGPPVEIGFVIAPRHAGGRGAFDSFAEAVRRADRARRPAGAAPPFVIAVFHPQGLEQFSGPHQLVSFLRRSPDPLLQLVRADRLDKAKSGPGDVSQQIAERNHAAMTIEEAARFNAIVRSIHADRDQAYRRVARI
jgi:hypothetical protein